MTDRKSTRITLPGGFALIEVLVAVGLLGIVSAGVASLMGLMVVSQASQKYGNNVLYETEQIRSTLSAPLSCQMSFLNFPLPTAAGTSVVIAGKQQIYDATGPTLKFAVGTMDIDKTVQIEKMSFTGYTPVGNAGFGEVQLIISYQPLHQVQAASRKTTIPLQTQADASGNLIACVSLAGLSNDIWQIVGKTQYDIFFNAPSNGNVGIGTATPSYRLDVEANSDSVMRIYGRNSSAGGSAMTALTLGNDSNPLGGGLFVNSSANATYGGANSFNMINNQAAPLALGTNNKVNMVIDQAGKVGIGTSAPRSRLEVNGTIITTAATQVPGNAGNITGGYYDIGASALATNTGYAYDSFCTQNTLGNCLGTGGVVIGRANSNASVNIPYAGATFFNGGNVGIGTTNPLTPLHVTSGAVSPVAYVDTQGSSGMSLKLEHRGSNLIVRPAAAGGNTTVVENTGGGPLALNPQGGFVGIGTTSASGTLEVATSPGNSGVRIMSGTNGDPTIQGFSNNGGTFTRYSSTGPQAFFAGGSDRNGGSIPQLFLANNGAVGIGTNNPQGLLALYEAPNGGRNGGAGMLSISNGVVTEGFNLSVGGLGNGFGQIGTISNHGFQLYANNSPFVTLMPNGDFLLPPHTCIDHGPCPGATLRVGSGGSLGNIIADGDISTMGGSFKFNGACVGGACSSDIRLKDHVRPFAPGLDALMQINPVYFRYNGLAGEEKSDHDILGVIAQDVEKGAPEVIVKAKVKLHPNDTAKTEIKKVNYTSLIYIVINAIKDLWTEITNTKDRIAHLEHENAEMKAYLCAKDAAAPFCKQ